MTETIRQVTIRGRVQGVGYRAWLEFAAQGLGLDGWVRNRRDGRVEALLAGDERVVAEMIALCRQGPSAARVDGVVDEEGHPDALNQRATGERFSVLPTL